MTSMNISISKKLEAKKKVIAAFNEQYGFAPAQLRITILTIAGAGEDIVFKVGDVGLDAKRTHLYRYKQGQIEKESDLALKERYWKRGLVVGAAEYDGDYDDDSLDAAWWQWCGTYEDGE
jgi:hypothetical protein